MMSAACLLPAALPQPPNGSLETAAHKFRERQEQQNSFPSIFRAKNSPHQRRNKGLLQNPKSREPLFALVILQDGEKAAIVQLRPDKIPT
jgi:hypothetical protein